MTVMTNERRSVDLDGADDGEHVVVGQERIKPGRDLAADQTYLAGASHHVALVRGMNIGLAGLYTARGKPWLVIDVVCKHVGLSVTFACDRRLRDHTPEQVQMDFEKAAMLHRRECTSDQPIHLLVDRRVHP